MNICIVFNSFSVVLLQQIQRVLHFTLDNESLSTKNWRATKIVRGPRALVLCRDTDKLVLFSLVKRTRGDLILLTNVWRANKDDRTKLLFVLPVDTARNSGPRLQPGALCPYTQIPSLACQPQWKQEFTLPVSYKNAALQCLLITIQSFFWTLTSLFLSLQFTRENVWCINYSAHLCSGPVSVLPAARW